MILAGDPVSLPTADEQVTLVVFHAPVYADPGRHHQPTPQGYQEWLGEVITETERILQPGGHLALITPNTTTQPDLDITATATGAVTRVGLTINTTRTWLPAPAAPGPHGEPVPTWQVSVAAKHPGTTITAPPRRRPPAPSDDGGLPVHLRRLVNAATWPIPTETRSSGRWIRQGDLPPDLVTLLISLYSSAGDLIATPLTGASTVVARTAARLRRRALCYEPDPIALDHLHQLTGAGEPAA